MFPIPLLHSNVKSFFFGLLIVLSFLASIGKSYADEGPYLISNESISEDTLTTTEVGNIFLGKKTTWKNNKPITFVILADGETHKQFVRMYLNKSQTQFKNYWKRMLFTGKGVIPKTFETDEKLIEYVSQNQNTIGYISKKIDAPGVKFISARN